MQKLNKTTGKYGRIAKGDKLAYKHGMRNTKTYKSWCEMKYRCDNKNFKDYKNYGGRGITYCDKWSDFIEFYKDMGDRPENKTLDRIDVNRNYEPGNCRWATRKEQARNTRKNKLYLGKTLAEWSEITGIKRSTMWMRIHKYNWDLRDAINVGEALREEIN